MITENNLPPEITNMARSLGERFRLLRIPSRKVAWSEWTSLPTAIQDLIPTWIPTLLSNYSLVDGDLECLHNEGYYDCMRYFSFLTPKHYQQMLSSGDEILQEQILAKGLSPISNENNGDLWVTSIKGGACSPIYLYDLSGQELVLAASRIELLMASMAVSPTSFLRNELRTSVMWYPEK